MKLTDPRPFYYLENFELALGVLHARYTPLLAEPELQFFQTFASLPLSSRALLVRLIMRKGDVFRRSRLRYEEIGDIVAAVQPLIEQGLLASTTALAVRDLSRLLKKCELIQAFGAPPIFSKSTKLELLAWIELQHGPAPRLDRWLERSRETLYRVLSADLCTLFRILFFGNFRQDWSAFVLADLGIFRYEPVPADARGRAFETRAQIDHFAALFHCRELLRDAAPPEVVLAQLPPSLEGCAWIEHRRAKLVLEIGQRLEREHRLEQALAVYRDCQHPHSMLRILRVLERLGRYTDAYELWTGVRARAAANDLLAGRDDALEQRGERIAARLARKLGVGCRIGRSRVSVATSSLCLERVSGRRVEALAADALCDGESAIFHVESALLNSLFGLLCWEAIFAPLPGAFFHDFHSAPADLLMPDFYARRRSEFDRCFARLQTGEHRRCVESAFAEKLNTASPFVAWGLLTPELLTLALDCIPASHLQLFFTRILSNLAENRSGLPDLIQFWHSERRYRMVEVKGPGDRLQDNQVRWLRYFAKHELPAAMCKVQWREPLESLSDSVAA